MNLILFISALAVFTLYLYDCYSKFGILPSISASAYQIKPKILFTLFTWSVAWLMFAIGQTPLLFFAAVFLSFSGTAGWGNQSNSEMEGNIHVIGANGGIILGFVSLWLDFHVGFLVIPMAIFTIYCMYFNGKIKGWLVKNHTYWIEVLAFVLIMIGLFIKRVL